MRKHSGKVVMVARLSVILVLLAGTALLIGCAHSIAPSGRLKSASEHQHSMLEAWADVYVDTGVVAEKISGDLIAMHADSAFVLSDFGLHAVARGDVLKITAMRHKQSHGPYAGWTTMGALSTLSHGFILLASAPAWILAGSFTTSSVSYLPFVRYNRGDSHRDSSWEVLRMYSRFPQGIPPNLDRTRLIPREYYYEPKPRRR